MQKEVHTYMDMDWSCNQDWVRKSITQGEDINTPHVHDTPWEPIRLSACVSIYL